MGVATGYQLVFDLHIPFDSKLRDTSIVGTAVTLSAIGVNDYFIVSNSNVGSATTSITAFDRAGVTASGIGKSFVDNIYVVHSVENIERTIRLDAAGVGIGTTVCRRVAVNINDSFDIGITTQSESTVAGYGNYSWGNITISSRTGLNSYTAYTENGILGITTSTRVERSAQLRFKNYDT